jgi:hypothetical protein
MHFDQLKRRDFITLLGGAVGLAARGVRAEHAHAPDSRNRRLPEEARHSSARDLPGRGYPYDLRTRRTEELNGRTRAIARAARRIGSDEETGLRSGEA